MKIIEVAGKETAVQIDIGRSLSTVIMSGEPDDYRCLYYEVVTLHGVTFSSRFYVETFAWRNNVIMIPGYLMSS